MDFSGKVALVTGGANGIGKATVNAFAKAGAKVAVVDRDEAGATAVAEAVKRSNGDAVSFAADVTNAGDVAAYVRATLDAYGTIDCFFNNAGIEGAIASTVDYDETMFDQIMSVNVKGVFLGIKHATRVMRPQGSGVVINTASVAGLQAGWSPHLYSVAKAAVIHLTKSVALELGEHGIRCNCICPGVIATPLAAGHPDTTDEQLDKFRTSLGKTQVLGRVGDPVDIANAAVWLASDESSFVTGHAQVVDGGAFAGKPWRKQGDWITKPRPIRMYRPEGR